MNNGDEKLDGCGCCEGVKPLTPALVANLPGLTALAYRVGTHGSFKETMLSELSGQPPLGPLTTREDNDPAIALLDGWATVLDVLSFYQERIANEGYLRTATERRSILEMARSIGYELRPGVAAGTYLAFALETGTGAPLSAKIPIGTKAQSTPAQDELPQTFETIDEIVAWGAWNELKPAMSSATPPAKGDNTLYLKGTSTNLKAGDALLVAAVQSSAGNPPFDFRRAASVTPIALDDEATSYTIVILDTSLASQLPISNNNTKVYALRQRAALFGYNAPDWRTMPDSLKAGYLNKDPGASPPTLHDSVKNYLQWPGFSIAEIEGLPPRTPAATQELHKCHLDAIYPQIIAGSWVVLVAPEREQAFQVSAVNEDARAEFGLNSKTTRLTLEGEDLREHFNDRIRDTVIFAQSEELALAERPITEDVGGNSIELSTRVEGLAAGRFVAIFGLDKATGQPFSEIAVVDRTEHAGAHTKVVFVSNLERAYKRDSVVINANVARATHGETREEVLGSGDGSRLFQKFALKEKPLTHVSAPTASGAESTLEVRVNDVMWDPAADFYRLAPGKRAYTTRFADDGVVTVQFGDGATGARPATGVENVTAKYRVGMGMSGMLAAEQINLLMTRPLGVDSVTNPIAPTGAEDPERLDQARQNAPLTVLALDRIVSLQDFGDFSRAFGGIGKAQSTWLWDGENRLIHLTIAGADGGAIPKTSDLYKNLAAGIDAARHADHRVKMDSYKSLRFNVDARLLIDSHYLFKNVKAAVEAALMEAFSFKSRFFGQAVTASEVIAIAQGVNGVTAVDLEKIYFTPPEAFGSGLSLPLAEPIALFRRAIAPARTPAPQLPANVAHWQAGTIQPAELLTINPAGIKLTEIAR